MSDNVQRCIGTAGFPSWMFLPQGGIVVNCPESGCDIGIIHDPAYGPTPAIEHTPNGHRLAAGEAS